MDLSSSRAPCPATVVRRRHQRRRTLTSCPLSTEPASVRPLTPDTFHFLSHTCSSATWKFSIESSFFLPPQNLDKSQTAAAARSQSSLTYIREGWGGREGLRQLILFLDSFPISLLDVRSCIKSKILPCTQTRKSLRSSAAIETISSYCFVLLTSYPFLILALGRGHDGGVGGPTSPRG